MKVYQLSKNNASLKSFILQLQLSLEFSQINEILSTYSEALLFLTEYSFLFENFSLETPSFKNTHTNFKSPFSSPDPARDGWNWWGYCAGNPVMNTDLTGLIFMPIKTILKIADTESQIIGATYDFVSQYNIMKEENIIGNDHYNHAMANSRATQRGKFGKATAQVLSFIREATDVIRKGDSDKDIREDNVANRYGRNIKPGENPEEYNAVFDTRQGGQRADLSNVASDESPKTIREFLNSFFTRDEYVNKKENNEEKNK